MTNDSRDIVPGAGTESAVTVRPGAKKGTDKSKSRRPGRKTKRGMLSLVIGFALQFVGNLLTLFQ